MKEGKRAVMYEIVTTGTSEVGTSIRRHKNIKSAPSGAAVSAPPVAAHDISSSGNGNNASASVLSMKSE